VYHNVGPAACPPTSPERCRISSRPGEDHLLDCLPTLVDSLALPWKKLAVVSVAVVSWPECFLGLSEYKMAMNLLSSCFFTGPGPAGVMLLGSLCISARKPRSVGEKAPPRILVVERHASLSPAQAQINGIRHGVRVLFPDLLLQVPAPSLRFPSPTNSPRVLRTSPPSWDVQWPPESRAKSVL